MKYPALMHNLTKVSCVECGSPNYICFFSIVLFLTFFLSSSLQSSVQLNRRVISDLAITEPQSFLSLAKLARARQQEGLQAALGDGKEPAGVFSRVVVLH